MVTKSEEDATMTEALGNAIEGYLVKPVTPRQVYAAVTRLLEGPRIRRQAVARRFVERFRELQEQPLRGAGWRDWIDRYAELTQWDLDLIEANETGLYESLQSLYPDLRREFAGFIKTSYSGWLRNLEGERPPLSIDISAVSSGPWNTAGSPAPEWVLSTMPSSSAAAQNGSQARSL